MTDVLVQTNPPSTVGTFFKTVLTLSIGAAIGVVGYKMFGPPAVQVFGAAPSTPRIRETNTGAGWYAVLYSSPPGTRGRSMKGLEGPFKTQAVAQVKADEESNVWYPVVRYYKTLPVGW